MHRFRQEPGSRVSDYPGLYLHGAMRGACQCRKKEISRKRLTTVRCGYGHEHFSVCDHLKHGLNFDPSKRNGVQIPDSYTGIPLGFERPTIVTATISRYSLHITRSCG